MTNTYQKFHWDEENKIATVTIVTNNNEFTGTAKCNEIDNDMCSEKTGTEIAMQRAVIQYLCHVRDNEIAPALRAYSQLYYSMNRSAHFTPKSYEAKMLYRAINRYTKDLEIVRDEIAARREALRLYIEKKDEFYQQIRRIRQKPSIITKDQSE